VVTIRNKVNRKIFEESRIYDYEKDRQKRKYSRETMIVTPGRFIILV